MGTDASRRLRILHIVRRLNYGGMERLVSEILRRGDRGALDNHVLTLIPPGRFGEGLEAFASLHRAPPLSKASILWPVALARLIRAIGPDVVHTHSGVWYKASLAAKLAGVPRIVHTEHGRGVPDRWIARALDGLASRRTDVVIAVSEAVARQLTISVVRYPSRVLVIPNGVDAERFAPALADGRLREELGVPGESPIVGSIGRLEPIKGYDVAITAFSMLLRAWPYGVAPTLVLAGDGSERHRLEMLAVQLGIAKDVRFLGWRDDIAGLLSTFAIFTMSSHSEGTSVSLLEAMSAGLCPVVTDVGGNAAVLGATLRHRLVPPDSPAGLAESWSDALRDPARREADGRAARERVLSSFTIDKMVEAYAGVYRAASSSHPVGDRS